MEPEDNPSRKSEKCFVFDDVFDEEETTQGLFDRVIKKSVSNVVAGYNLTIFAYGMTGAGKSFTMFGDCYDNYSESNLLTPGLISLSTDELFTLNKS